MFVSGKNMRDSEAIPACLDPILEAGDRQFAVIFWQRAFIEQMNEWAKERRKAGQ